jgi:membrane protease YdiL (CAAX protease family)
MGFKKAIIISSICFGLIHFNIGQVSYAIVLGLVLGFASVVAKNLWVPIIMHFTNNFIAIYLEFAEANGWWLGNYENWIARLGEFDFWVICVICFVGLKICLKL